MTRIEIAGAVSVGKTTITRRLLEAEPTWSSAPESVSEHRFLDRFYSDPTRWSFHSRVEFLAIKGSQLLDTTRKSEAAEAPLQLIDRSVPELIAFARVMHSAGTLSADEFQLYDRLYQLLLATLPAIDGTLWLRADTDVCLRRIQERGRVFEQGIGAAYLDSLDAAYESWFSELEGPKLRIDTTSDDWWERHGEEAIDWVRGYAR
jgi:deoxyadenosine/deoxycytidine kinase